MLREAAPASVKLFAPVVLKFLQLTSTSMVTEKPDEPDATLKYTSSVDVGSDAPPGPPEVDDQWLLCDQLPDPPTQYLLWHSEIF